MTSDGPSSPGGGGSRRARLLLSFFFVLHWGAVAVYILPKERSSLELLPDPLEETAFWVIPRLVRAAWPVAQPYVDMTATRQHWTLFAPWPASWSSSIRVVPFFPVAGTDTLWQADTVEIQGPVERGPPYFLHHRTYRLLYNLGYDSWGTFYRPFFAREMCRSLQARDGRTPSGLSLVAEWRYLVPPWEGEGARPEASPLRSPSVNHTDTGDEAAFYRQWLGGFDCAAQPDTAGHRAWSTYGLPDPLPVEGWPRVGPASGGGPEAAVGAPLPDEPLPGVGVSGPDEGEAGTSDVPGGPGS